jgi:hypothetical protein
MVKKRKDDNTKRLDSKGNHRGEERASKINASTVYETCTEQLSPFGGLLGLIKFIDVVELETIFKDIYISPKREPKLGHYHMIVGILMLLFIGFNRLWHFTYIRLDAILCGFFHLALMPVASTFWRYVDSLGVNQAGSLVRIMRVLRERVWLLCDIKYEKIHLSTDTTVTTVYGDQEGGRKGHNSKNRGKKGYRPVLCFIDETRECLIGKLRTGETISSEEVRKFIGHIKKQLPGCVKEVLFRGDGEFFGWESVTGCIKAGFDYIIANKGARPSFDPKRWYKPNKKEPFEYNSCVYQPMGWDTQCRFVAMRFPKDIGKSSCDPVQYELFEDDRYTYRIFVTSLIGKAHKVIVQYDKRADVENLVGEAKREGLDAIPSNKFKNNYAYFQIVMLAYNIWRYFKIMAQMSDESGGTKSANKSHHGTLKGLSDNHIRIARLKLLLIAAKVVYHSNKDKVKYSIHDMRTPGLLNFYKYLDKARGKVRPWVEGSLLPCRFSIKNA